MNRIFYEIFEQMPRQGPGKSEYTKRALSFCQLPPKPQILDIGCGTGAQTLSLAESTDGLITAVDNHGPFLKELSEKAKALGLDSKIQVLHGDMNRLGLKQKFDLIWSEGSIFVMGFEKGLREWKKFLKPDGFMALTEVAWIKDNPPTEALSFWEQEYPAIKDISSNRDIIRSAGYSLIQDFIMPKDAWDDFYSALKIIIHKIKSKDLKNQQALNTIGMFEREVKAYQRFGEFYGYVFFILLNYGS
ncbi:MAG: methyltransferase domain-containing protein [Candidatus Aminicenantes bacterium]|nr:methyltransferase domain-containing protein [Candidatus Aminicenantes bacterium]